MLYLCRPFVRPAPHKRGYTSGIRAVEMRLQALQYIANESRSGGYGDSVNLASRLESACKEYSAQILCSENTYKKLKGSYRAREIDRVIVKGKTEPVSVYEILDFHTDESFPNMPEALNLFRGGLKYYRGGRV